MNTVLNNFTFRVLAFACLSFGCGFAMAKAVHKPAQPAGAAAHSSRYFYSAQPLAAGPGTPTAA
ncbi:hypothetical protein [Hymenobacter nivis]|uniref:Uncharacterized protein n=1 Tax=Hymenobacter nivis TaxID=1850093 RepID=A0A2Z3GX16_9BACT|nr:hypothetical protein [Hymenobacter nivis]AWM33270.1 hypothetical protein DDQ68_11050 [Hymenobacter nivis]